MRRRAVRGRSLDGHTSLRDIGGSPDGTRVVSDQATTVRIWDAASGECVVGPLTGTPRCEIGGVLSDGTRVVSGRTIRCAFGMRRGEAVVGPLDGTLTV